MPPPPPPPPPPPSALMSRRGRTASGSHRCATSQSSFERFYIILHCQVGGGGGWAMGIDNCTGEAEPSFSDIQLHTARYPCCSVARLHVFVLCSRLGMHEHDQICSPNTDPERIAQLPRCCNLLFSISRMRACHICEFEQQCGCHVDVATLERMACSMHVRWCYNNIWCLCGSPAFCILIVHPV